MRTAEEWVKELDRVQFSAEHATVNWWTETIKAIQLDALREAAEIARIAAHRLGGYQFTHDAILARIKEVEG